MSLADFRTLNGFKTEEQKAAEQAAKQAAEQAAEDIKLEIITIEDDEYEYYNVNIFLTNKDLIVGYCRYIEGNKYEIKSGIEYEALNLL